MLPTHKFGGSLRFPTQVLELEFEYIPFKLYRQIF